MTLRLVMNSAQAKAFYSVLRDSIDAHERTYALLNRESPEFIRFVNPSDYRVVRESCGACHVSEIETAERSLMSTGAMLWGGAAYRVPPGDWDI